MSTIRRGVIRSRPIPIGTPPVFRRGRGTAALGVGIRRPAIAILSLLLGSFLSTALPAQQETTRKPRIYVDPEGRFSLELSGDWVKVATTQKDVVGCFLVTAKVEDGRRRIVAEVIISRTEMEAPVSLDEYVKAEDGLVLRTPGFRRGTKQKAAVLAQTPAVRNGYVFLLPDAAPGSVEKLVYQVHVVKEKEVWGLTFSALKDDEPFLGQVEKSVVSSFQFSVPEGANEAVPEASKKVTATGPMGGFSLSAPESWQVDQSDEYGLSIRGVECVVYAFSVNSPPEGPSVQDAAGRFLKERENLNELRVLSQGTERVAGMDGYIVEYSGVGEGRQWRVRLATLLAGNKLFFVYSVSPEEGWKRNETALKRIEQSFTVATPAGEADGSEGS